MNGVTGPHIIFQGANLHVRSATAETDGSGLGNLIVGWNDVPNPALLPMVRSGSNNLVLGAYNNFTGCGSLVGGEYNQVASWASVVGAFNNAATSASIMGGYGNIAYGSYSSIGGGWGNRVSGTYNTVSGGVDRSSVRQPWLVDGRELLDGRRALRTDRGRVSRCSDSVESVTVRA